MASAIALPIASTKFEQFESVEGQALVEVLTDNKGSYNAEAKTFASKGWAKRSRFPKRLFKRLSASPRIKVSLNRFVGRHRIADGHVTRRAVSGPS